MKNYDVKHIAYHVLVAIYFIWFAVFAILLSLALNNYYGVANLQLSKLLLTLIGLNLFMGTALFLVLQQFRKQTVLARVLFYGYFFLTSASLTTVLIVIQ
ncbi:hypothetical protein AM493_07645 [Flavobacterium akiainvivens]|uniref:Uncharacterized protein n=1 Tax=Flavobacterium akiainvivens TaxID=1202724 RepID=A0A0M9VHU0_9FLAO|nr:hypothetical protein [Flavobacterium akiainvivens]KOS05919.1 hypothetical protein AM493_07645 [Flavobacterium akiainvivens]SFQ53230.1 hypothetical protein SAMN05444144_1077 [Flavobacterium akiainvivens]